MKCILKIVVVLINLVSISSLGMNSGITAQDLLKLKLKSGQGDPSKVLSDDERALSNFINHRAVFSETLGKIASQSEIIKSAQSKESKLIYVQKLLPATLHRNEIVVLAEFIGFSHNDDFEVRASKLVRLALLTRDIYDVDNLVSRNLGFLETPTAQRLSPHEIVYYVAEALEHATKYLAAIAEYVPSERAIDFNLSYAQVLLWRLYYGQKSLVHSLTDFHLDGDKVTIGVRRMEIFSTILDRLVKAETLMRDDAIALPVIYTREMQMLAKRLTKQQKFDLILMHKGEIDAARDASTGDALRELEKARGLSDGERNPLDYFTPEKVRAIEETARKKGCPEDAISRIVYSTMEKYSDKKVAAVDKYFTQDVLQRFLLKEQIITRDMLRSVLMAKVGNLRVAAQRIMGM